MTKPPAKATKAEIATKPPEDGLQAALERAVVDIVPNRQARQVAERVRALVVSEQYSGPLPHPAHMEAYAAMIPDGANRLMVCVEKNIDHKIYMERTVYGDERADRRLGMILGFAALVLLNVAALLTVWMGAHVSIPIAFLSASALGVIGAFIKGRHK